ncbi:MAG: divergent polysaccharide deacetylase family protein [Desulfovibrionaceae bacterium]
MALALAAGCGDRTAPTQNASAPQNGDGVVRAAAQRQLDYEVFSTGDLEDKTRLADLAIIQSLRQNGLSEDDLRLEDIRMNSAQGERYHFQVLRLLRNETFDAFIDTLSGALASRLPSAVVFRPEDGGAYILLDKIPTHQLLPPSAPEVSPAPEQTNATKAPAPRGRLAIVIDDLGEDLQLARGLANLPASISFSIWPRSSHAKETAALAASRGRDILVHQPMEPHGYPKVNPGPNALMVGMTRQEIENILDDSISRAPGAKGMNNHMGSKFTEWGPGMKVVLQRLRDKGFYFLDSLTTAQSVGGAEARRAGTAFCRRSVFLDNTAETQAILHQLKKVQRLAEREGSAIAIGHPHPATLEALTLWLQSLPPDVEVVGVSQLAH